MVTTPCSIVCDRSRISNAFNIFAPVTVRAKQDFRAGISAEAQKSARFAQRERGMTTEGPNRSKKGAEK